MNVLVWITEDSWEPAVDAARAVARDDAALTLLYVTPDDVAEAAGGAVAGMLGRRPPRGGPEHRDPVRRIEALSSELADELLASAAERLGRPAERVRRAGRPEREVVAAAEVADLLVVGRGGEERPGPRSIAPSARFVVDHARCAVLVVWTRR